MGPGERARKFRRRKRAGVPAAHRLRDAALQFCMQDAYFGAGNPIIGGWLYASDQIVTK
jgi:hypothetical protein